MTNSEIECLQQTPLEKLLADARKKLVETGTRNRLVHVNRENVRANVLNIINERSDDVFDILRVRSRKMKFLATGIDPKKNAESDAPLLDVIDEITGQPFDEARYKDNQLETKLGPDRQQKRLLRLFRDAKTAEEEQGINILYLALGFLNWFEAKDSAVKRAAPLILLPVELTRNQRTSTYDLSVRDDEIVTNLPLQKRLLDDFGIELPEIVEGEEGWTPSSYFDLIEENISAKPEWSIDRNGMQLGFFSFAKLLMLRDLDPENWPNGGLNASSLIEGLLLSGFAEEDPLFSKDARLDEILSPADIIQVVDADASQTKVIEEVRTGRNLVVQGPPGTGKSQTITNIIAAAVHDGKSVLFVAEKMAALSVVHNRLKGVGLDTICLELHSRAANKKQVLAELANTLSQGTAVPNQPDNPNRLKSLRDQLNSVASILHSPISKSGETPYSAIAQMVRLAGLGAQAPSLVTVGLAEIDAESLSDYNDILDQYGLIIQSAGQRSKHPFFGTRKLNLQPLEVERLANNSSKAAQLVDDLQTYIARLDPILGIEAKSIKDIQKVNYLLNTLAEAPGGSSQFLDIKDITPRMLHALTTAVEWKEFQTKNDNFSVAAWTIPVQHLRGPLANGAGSFFARWGSAYRKASRELATMLANEMPRSADQRLQLLDTLIAGQTKRKKYSDEENYLKNAIGVHWQGEGTHFNEIAQTVDWLDKVARSGCQIPDKSLGMFANSPEKAKSLLDIVCQKNELTCTAIAEIEKVLDLDSMKALGVESLKQLTMRDLSTFLNRISSNERRYGEWAKFQTTADKLAAAHLIELVERIDQESMNSEQAKQELRYARAEAIWKQARQERPELNQMNGLDRHDIVEEFKACESERITDVRTLINSRHLDQLPKGAIGEMAVIRSELARRRGHKPIRKLITQAGSMIQKIKPVLLMSPISVAQYLPPEQLRFDILVIDEASQVRPEDALGAIARCDQIVVVGDQKQLPPTSFFDRMTGNSNEDDDEDDPLGGAARATEMESILSLCEARAIPQRMLEWHYRSRDPSLIAVSNREFYKNNLVLPPSPLQNDDAYGLRFTRVQGAYSSATKGGGSPGTNKIEAQAVVEAIAHHARELPELSLGVVSFSVRQRNMITEILEFERRTDPILDDFLREGRAEDVFVKNIENVQGDERDIILVSVGYGPNEPGGRLATMSFGPVNSEGGERRLNVMFSRARVRCEIFASFDPGGIDLSRTQKNGPRVLKRFMEYAKSGKLDQAIPSGGAADSPFEDDVADVIRSLGYVVDHQIGSAGFLIDLGVKHPDRAGQYMLAVECDGATYHSALWARERDRLRQDVLEHLGWRFHRIWSTDWFYRRAQETDRLRNALEEATRLGRDGIFVGGANEGAVVFDEDDDDVLDNNINIVVPEIPALKAEPYIVANVKTESMAEPHEAPMRQLIEIINAIVLVEGPIHQDEIARRLASAFGKGRAGKRINDLTMSALMQAQHRPVGDADAGQLLNDQQFWFTETQARNIPVRDRREQSATIQKAENIPPMEIRAAIQEVVKASGTAEKDDIIRATARLFGFDRVGTGLRAAISAQVNNLSNDPKE